MSGITSGCVVFTDNVLGWFSDENGPLFRNELGQVFWELNTCILFNVYQSLFNISSTVCVSIVQQE